MQEAGKSTDTGSYTKTFNSFALTIEFFGFFYSFFSSLMQQLSFIIFGKMSLQLLSNIRIKLSEFFEIISSRFYRLIDAQ